MSDMATTPSMPGIASRRAATSAALSTRVGLVLLACGGAALLAAIYLRMMNFELRKDELLYAAPVVLLDHLRLYSDFFYNHTPGSAWYFHAFGKALGMDGVLITARTATFAVWVLFAAAVFWFSWVFTRSLAFVAFALTAVLANDLLLSVPGMTATNNFLALPFGYIGLALFALGTMGERVRPWAVFGAGVSLALAATFKASAGAFIVPVVVATVLMPCRVSLGGRVARIILPLAAGGILAALPVLMQVAADPDLLIAHLLGFHTGPHVAYWAANAASEPNLALSLAGRLRLGYEIWFTGTNLAILMTAAILVALSASRGWQGIRALLSNRVAFFVATFAFVFATCFVPTPSFPQYFAPVLAVAPLLLAALYCSLDPEHRRAAEVVFAAGAIVALVANAPRLGEDLPRAASPAKWTAAAIHDDGKAIADAIAANTEGGRLATLFPLYGHEGRIEVYPEFATGPFAYRIVPFTEPGLADQFVAVGPGGVAELFDRDPPAAFLLGFDAILEAPLLEYVMDNNYEALPDLEVSNRYGSGTLYVKTPGALTSGDPS